MGTPEDIVKNPRSHTGRFLKQVLERKPLKTAREAAE
jgi:excinuclease ABC subunit A